MFTPLFLRRACAALLVSVFSSVSWAQTTEVVWSAATSFVSGSEKVILGFAVTQQREVVVRGLGATVVQLNRTLPGWQGVGDVKLTLLGPGGVVVTNSSYTSRPDAAAVAGFITGRGGIALAAADPAVSVVLSPGVYSLLVEAENGSGYGYVGAEIYPRDQIGGVSNVSARGYIRMINTFNTPWPNIVLTALRTTVTLDYQAGGPDATLSAPVLVRAAGPVLATFGLTSAEPDPFLALAQRSSGSGPGPIQINAPVIATFTNNNWGTAPGVAALAAARGAFPFPAGSLDSALSVTPTPRKATATVSTTRPASVPYDNVPPNWGTTTETLVEIYF